MVHGGVFSGQGGFELAAEIMGWENAFHCEKDPFCQRILKYYWPHAKSYGDIKTTDFSIWHGLIDVLTGGFPCQPYSSAGKREGKADARHLWPEMLRAIREIHPAWVVGENVLGLINWNGGMVFDEVQFDLETAFQESEEIQSIKEIGYEVFPFVLPACAVDAPHRRDRVWFVAYSASGGRRQVHNELCSEFTGGYGPHSNGTSGHVADTANNDDGKHFGEQEGGQTQQSGIGSKQGATSNTPGQGREERAECGHAENKKEDGTRVDDRPERSSSNGSTSHTDAQRLSLGLQSRIRENGREDESHPGRSVARTFSAQGWEEFPTQSPICIRDDGFSSQLDGITFPKWRAESIRAAGNAVVPQVVLQIFKSIDAYNKLHGNK